MADLKAENEALKKELEAMKKFIMLQQSQTNSALDIQELMSKLSANEGKEAQQSEPSEPEKSDEEEEQPASPPSSSAAVQISSVEPTSTSSSVPSPSPEPQEEAVRHNRETGEVGNPASRSRGTSSEPEDQSRRHSGRTFGYTWSWMECKGLWREYDPEICDIVEQAFVKGQNTVCASQDHVSFCCMQ
jgi:hypothetical protein